MAWDKTGYINSLKTAFNRAKTDSIDDEITEQEVRDNFATDLADALDTAIGTMDVTIPVSAVSLGVSPSVVLNPAPILMSDSVS